jgi:hypothetical protein
MVGQRGEELVVEAAVRRVDFDQFEAGRQGSGYCAPPGGHDSVDLGGL